MTKVTDKLIHSLNEKTSIIKNELLKLKEENTRLQEELTQKQINFDKSQVALGELKNKYNALKLAKSLDQGEDTQALKKRIDAMVREIDTCIELIDE